MKLCGVSAVAAQTSAKYVFQVFGPKYGHFEFFQKSKRSYLRIISISNILNHNYIDSEVTLCCISPVRCKLPYFKVFFPQNSSHFDFFQKFERRYLMIIFISNILNHNYIEPVDSLRCIGPDKCKMLYF